MPLDGRGCQEIGFKNKQFARASPRGGTTEWCFLAFSGDLKQGTCCGSTSQAYEITCLYVHTLRQGVFLNVKDFILFNVVLWLDFKGQRATQFLLDMLQGVAFCFVNPIHDVAMAVNDHIGLLAAKFISVTLKFAENFVRYCGFALNVSFTFAILAGLTKRLD